MSWTHDDPAQGSPSGIQGVATLRSTRASKVRDAQQVIQRASAHSGVDWEAASQKSFAAALSKNAADIELVAAGLEAQAAALKTYAGQLSQLQDRQSVLEAKRASAQQDLASATAKLPIPDLFPSSPVTFPGSKPAPSAAPDPDFQRQKAAAEGMIADAQASRRAVEAEWETLVADRRRIDATCAAALQSGEVLGGLSRFAGVDVASKSPDSLLAMLVGLSATDREMLLATNPDLSKRIAQASPEAVAAWWAAIGAHPGASSFSEQQQWFISAMPAVMGALDGLAPGARVAANKINAAKRLEADQNELNSTQLTISLLEGHVNTQALQKRVQQLSAEIGYLKEVVADKPSVNLYLYQPDTSRIIEMVGTISSATDDVVTYSPGTFADLDGFYGGHTQAMAQWLVGQHPNTVAFVYKDGMFPGEDKPKSDGNLLRIGEANDPERALASGRRLAEFQHGLNLSDQTLREAKSTAIGHSWGLANITASEVEGAHYNNVISLAGAGMPHQWKANPSTNYVHEGYPDILWEAQLTGGVWDGNVPLSSPAFHSHFYPGPNDVVDKTTVLGVNVYSLDQKALMANHNVIATVSNQNGQVMADVENTIYGDQ